MGYLESLQRFLCPREKRSRKWKPQKSKDIDAKGLGLSKDPKMDPNSIGNNVVVEEGSTVAESLNGSSSSLNTKSPSSLSGTDLDLESERKQYRARKWRNQICRDAETIFQPLFDRHRSSPKHVRTINKQKRKWAEQNWQTISKKLDSNMSEQTMQHVYRIYVWKFRAKIDPGDKPCSQ